MEQEQIAQRDLVQRMLDYTGLDATNLAVRDNLAPSTLTRFMGPKPVKHLLSSKTLAKLYAASGLAPKVPPGGYLVEHPDQIALLMVWDDLDAAARRGLLSYIRGLKRRD